MSGVKNVKILFKLRAVIAVSLVVLGASLQGARAQADTLVIFAAASLGGALDAVLEEWEGAQVAVSYASSALLARQIEAGAPADLFISANTDWMEYLSQRQLTQADTTRSLLGNQLVLAGRAGDISPTDDLAQALAALPPDARIATGLIQSVPAGIYARDALAALGLLEDYLPRLVQTENVRVALALAARGEVARAFVYRSDAMAETDIAIESPVPSGLHDRVLYPATILERSTHPQALALLDYLASPAAMTRFAEFGFEAPE